MDRKGVILIQYFVDHKDTIYIGGTEVERKKQDSLNSEIRFFTQKSTYTKIAAEKGIEGTVIISFKNKQG